jgi:D-alanine-D-alanine ligase
LGLRDVARLDFRVTPSGEVVFLEANALPSLDPHSAIYTAAEAVGLKTVESVLRCVLASAAERWGLKPAQPGRDPRSGIRVGLVFNLKRVMPRVTGENDEEAEFDSPTTVQALQAAIASHGHEVVPMEATPDLLQKITIADVDMVFNIAEGIRGRARESLVPSILEMLDIPYTGSDPVTLALTLDKGLAKRIVRQAGVHTPEWAVMTTGREKLPPELTFPVICKPVAEGSSKGVSSASVVHSDEELRKTVREILERYRQGVLVEQFLPGREFTVGVLGERRPHVLPPMEIVFRKKAEQFPIYTFAHKQDWTDEVEYVCPAKTDDKLGRELVKAARRAFTALDCRDVARIDLRLDAQGRVNFIECNPLPGLTPDWSDLCIIAKAAGLDYRSLVGEIMAPALRRVRQRRRDSANSSERRSS